MNINAFKEKSNSLVAKHLSEEIFKELSQIPTKSGYTIKQAIQSGLDNPDSGIGIYAGDSESYHHFSSIFHPIIEDYHQHKINTGHQFNFDEEQLDFTFDESLSHYIVSTRVRTARNLADFPFGGHCTSEQRTGVEKAIVDSLRTLEGELAGQYYPLTGMTESMQEDLIQRHFLFKQGDRFLASAGLNQDWPNNRGIYFNADKTFLVWVNEEDQLRIISMEKGGDIVSVFSRLARAVRQLEKKLDFAKDDKLGYLTSCPSNIGTGIRASVHIRLENLANDMKKLEEIAAKYHLQVRGQFGEHSASKDPIFDISNKRRLGLSELDCIGDLFHGVKAIITAEKLIEAS